MVYLHRERFPQRVYRKLQSKKNWSLPNLEEN